MMYDVWIEQSDGSGRINLSTGNDGDKASQLAGALVGAASGHGFNVGINITQGGPNPNEVTRTPVPAPAERGGRR